VKREDEYGHLIDENGELVDDPRCYWCLAEQAAEHGVTVVRVDAPPTATPGDGS